MVWQKPSREVSLLWQVVAEKGNKLVCMDEQHKAM